MPNQTVKIVAVVAALIVVIAAGVMWKLSASRRAGPRPGVDVPMRGM
jgi:hypothetical protein